MSAPRRVLVVDDNEASRYLVARILAGHGYQVLEAATGQQALETARREQPDVVVLDVKLPDIHGFEVAAQLKADPQTRSIAVLHLSASFTAAEARAEGLRRGADAYLTHPVDPEVLCASVGALVRLREAELREREARERAEQAQAEREHLLQELQASAAERERLIERLREEDRRKTEFLAILSHELRNPLAPIRNSVHILERAAPGGEQSRRAREIIDRQAEQLTRLIDDLLDITRISNGKIRLQSEPVELGQLVRGVGEDLRPVFDSRGVELAVRVEAAPLFVQGDPTRLAQVVGNLLQNSAKFTPRGGRAELSLSHAGEEAVVRVRDNGAGIQPEVLPRLFEPFVQADRTLDRSNGGLGLGLALVKALVELHGGEVSAASGGPGSGAEFTVRLPLAAGVSAENPSPPSGVGATGRRVLVIEDNEDAARTLKDVLELAGHHEVEIAYDGAEGLARARQFHPDVVLCDLGLPGMNGYEVAKAMRAEPALRPTILVALSGYALQDDVDRSAASGFDHHLAKPPDLAALARLLQGAVTAGGASGR